MKNYKTIITVLLLILFSAQLFAEGDEKNKQTKLYKTNGQPHYARFNINNISTWIFDNGRSDLSLYGNSGFEYPKASGKAVFYESGFVYGGKVNNEIRVGGSTYRPGQVPGRIIAPGIAEDTSLASVRIYKVRPDYKTSDLSDELYYIYEYTYSDSGTYISRELVPAVDISKLRNQYEKDWNEWPANYGAPYEDINNDGIYNPQIDIPGVPGAHQTIWFVANDLDENQTKFLYGSPPIGIEMQATFWGYKSDGPLGNVMFRKYTVINKSENIIDSMYFSMWSDSEIGDATDDFVGCDTLLNMTYAYNGDDHDATYGFSVPACGFTLLQGPVIEGNFFDEANFKGRKIEGMKNLDMTSFHYIYKCCGPDLSGDPPMGEYEGSIAMYNYFQGLTEIGNPFPIPESLGGGYTKFPLSGDPITNQGNVDGIFAGPADRRMGLGTGPFTMAVGDTQEVIYAQLAAGGTLGINRLEAIKYLRFYSTIAKQLYDNNFEMPNYSGQLKSPLFNITDTNSVSGIELNWKYETNKEQLEKLQFNGYTFQGYNLYQLTRNVLNLLDEEKVLIRTFDTPDGVKNIEGLVPNPESGYPQNGIIQFGSDSGIEYLYKIEKDYLSNLDLAKGKKYFYGLSAYYYNPNANGNEKVIQSPISITEIIYKKNFPGYEFGDEINVLADTSDLGGIIKVKIVIPDKLTGHTYKVDLRKINNVTVYDLFDVTAGIQVLQNQELINYADYISPEFIINTPVTDGFQLIVVDKNSSKLQPGGIVEVAYGRGLLPEDGWDQAGAPYFGNSVWNDTNWDNGSRDKYQIKLNDSNSGSYRINFARHRDFEIRFTDKKNYGFYYDGVNNPQIIDVPFELWDIGVATPGDITDDIRMIPGFDSRVRNDSTWRIDRINSPYVEGESDVIRFYDPETKDGYYRFAEVAENAGGVGSSYPINGDGSTDGLWIKKYNRHIISSRVIDRLNFVDIDKDGNYPENGTVIRILTQKALEEGNSYSFFTTKINNIEQEFILSQNYPNPFNPSTKIRFYMNKMEKVNLEIFNILGQKVNSLVNSELEKGQYEYEFKGTDYSSGVYFYRLTIGSEFTEVKKMILLK